MRAWDVPKQREPVGADVGPKARALVLSMVFVLGTGVAGCARACGEDPPPSTVRRAGRVDQGGQSGRVGRSREQRAAPRETAAGKGTEPGGGTQRAVEAGPDARAVSLAPRLAAPTAAQRAFDRRHRRRLLRLVRRLRETRQRLDRLARKGAAEPAFRARWPAARRRYLERVGRLRARALAVDPLGRRSWAVGVATRLLTDLESRLPDAVQASWAARPSEAPRARAWMSARPSGPRGANRVARQEPEPRGFSNPRATPTGRMKRRPRAEPVLTRAEPLLARALITARADFDLIWRRLRRYVKALKTEASKGSPP